MGRQTPVLRALGGPLLVGALAVLFLSPFELGSMSARADGQKKPPAKQPPAKAPPPTKAPPAKGPHAVLKNHPSVTLPKALPPRPHHAKHHPAALAAMHKLEEAYAELANAPPVFGNHQLVALELIVVAYEHLVAGVSGHPGPAQTELANFHVLPQASDFPIVRTALAHIHEAQVEAKKAAPMHGHRRNAIVALNRAITQIGEGLIYARHPRW
jgi:hypothetical protein